MKLIKKNYYGIVEGFFSRPLPKWTTKERLNVLKFVTANAKSINTYFYCPKDDSYVTKKWSSLYPEAELNELRKTINYCKKNKITFVYGFNPTIDNNERQITQDIVIKVKQIKEIGCNHFCLLFDDIPVAYDVVDKNVQGTLPVIKSIVKVVNKVYSQIKDDIENLWFCGPDYCLSKETLITKELRTISKDISFIWTGRNIFVKNITLKDFRTAQKVVDKKRGLIWWSNYPANDCEQSVGTFNLGGFNGPSQEALRNLRGILFNPMRESYANFPFLLTFIDYLKEKDKYDRVKSWKKALKKLLGRNWKNYELILENFSSRNITDDNFKYFYRQTRPRLTQKYLTYLGDILRNLKITHPETREGKLFINVIGSVLEDADGFLKIVGKILAKKLISKKEFKKWDKFPTNTEVTKYLPEIFKIAQKRLEILPKNLYSETKLAYLQDATENFQDKYRGGKKLFMPKWAVFKIKDVIRQITNLEATAFVKFFNSPDFSPREKVEALALRQNINRFYC